jgi:hypothetical protein
MVVYKKKNCSKHGCYFCRPIYGLTYSLSIKNYVSAKDFVSGREIAVPFEETPSDIEILKDTSIYRVF